MTHAMARPTTLLVLVSLSAMAISPIAGCDGVSTPGVATGGRSGTATGGNNVGGTGGAATGTGGSVGSGGRTGIPTGGSNVQGTGGASTGTGGARTSTGGASTSTGGASTSTGGASTSTGGASTSTGGVRSGTGGASTGTGGARSGTGGASTGTGGRPPDGGVVDASTTSGTGGTAGGSALEAATQLCVDTINMYRATLGLAPYARWTQEETCTSGEALTDSQSGTAHSAFGTCTENAQDECPSWPGSLTSIVTGCLAQMWAEGPGTGDAHGHYINMSSTRYTKVACGFSTGSNGKTWATQNFK